MMMKPLLLGALFLAACTPSRGAFVCTSLVGHHCQSWAQMPDPPAQAPTPASAPPRECGINGVPCTPPGH